MSVSRLPPEIWLLILECLPPSFFQEDIRRLALSRRWYSLAFPTFFPRIEYTPKVISRLVNRKSKALIKARAVLRKSLRTVNIVLDGMAPWSDLDNMCFDTASNLIAFCAMLADFKELRTVCFTARWPNRQWLADPLHVDYLPLKSMQPFLNMFQLPHLTVLDLDLCGTEVTEDSRSNPRAPVHFCHWIKPLLSQLHTLRLRTRRICREAVRPLQGQTLSIKNLTIHIYLGKVSDSNPKLNSARLCRSPNSWEWINPATELRSELRRLAAKITPPKRVQIVHLAPTGEVHTWDASTDECVLDRSEPKRSFPMFGNVRDAKVVDCVGRAGANEDSDIVGTGDGTVVSGTLGSTPTAGGARKAPSQGIGEGLI
ncbi:hypothetical protein B0H67DRAFT_603733 [Lasiosphaeris hirsuta]|uniref:F-box domain-containing protein n=1 Tax=Lasiosphaeris hirsuta TaxID=260670 RepID=A0AA39ZVZ9_9PEZI|nr:hypothetical protein B0H67DRAFT_603733 [Lasiosphaeris hirsuta]